MNTPSILSSIPNNSSPELNLFSTNQSSNSGISFNQELSAQTEKLDGKNDPYQSKDTQNAQSERKTEVTNSKISESSENKELKSQDKDTFSSDNTSLAQAIASMALAPSLIGGINVVANLANKLTNDEKTTEVKSISDQSGLVQSTELMSTIGSTSTNQAMRNQSMNDFSESSNKDAIKTAINSESMKVELDGNNLKANSSLQNSKLANTGDTIFNQLIQQTKTLNTDSKNPNNIQDLKFRDSSGLKAQLPEVKLGTNLKNESITSLVGGIKNTPPSETNTESLNVLSGMTGTNNHASSSSMNISNLNEIKAPLSSPDWGPALNQRVTWMITNELQNANITINPANLGPVEISIQTDQNKTNVQFFATSIEARQAIQDAIPSLSKMLESSGLQLGQADINSKSFGQNRENSQATSQIKNIEILSNQSETISIQGQGLINTYV